MGRVIVVQGATAAGKSAVAAHLAAHYGVAVVSADSRQFYCQMRIGTAVPTQEELAAARHYFIQDRSVTQPLSAGGYEREAVELLDGLNEHSDDRQIIAVVVGGSGLYVDALLYGLDPLPSSDEVRAELIAILERDGLEPLVEALRMADPTYHNIVDRSNPQRVIRALEVCRTSGMPYSNLRSGRRSIRSFDAVKLVVDLQREQLYQRIERRVDQMMDEGLEQEARSVEMYRHLTPLQTVGYSEMFDYFDGNTSLERAVELIKQHTRNYAKRQLTWLRRDEATPRFDPTAINEMISYIG